MCVQRFSEVPISFYFYPQQNSFLLFFFTTRRIQWTIWKIEILNSIHVQLILRTSFVFIYYYTNMQEHIFTGTHFSETECFYFLLSSSKYNSFCLCSTFHVRMCMCLWVPKRQLIINLCNKFRFYVISKHSVGVGVLFILIHFTRQKRKEQRFLFSSRMVQCCCHERFFDTVFNIVRTSEEFLCHCTFRYTNTYYI